MTRYKITLFCIVLISVFTVACSKQQLVPDSIDPVTPLAMDSTEVLGIGDVGKWMISPSGQIADWGGLRYKDQVIHEAINVIFIDAGAKSAAEAKTRLVDAMTRAGYPPRYHHSSGYRGIIDGEIYGQIPTEDAYAFSNQVYLLDNNHGRVFGPKQTTIGWVFTAAFSREDVSYLRREHLYASFSGARDDLAMNLNEKSIYKRAETVSLDNGSTSEYTTGDHDGSAIVMRAQNSVANASGD